MVSNSESNALAKQLPIGYKIQNYTVKAYLNQSYFANIYLVEAPSTGENQQEVKQFVLKEYFPYFVSRQADYSLDAGGYQEHLAWGKAHALKKAQFLAQINSPHVANIRSYFEANNTMYLVRDYYQGLTLTEWLRQMRLEHLVQKLDLSPDAISEAMLSEVKLSFKDTEKLIYPVIDALSFMHSYRASEFAYSHENISPDNIFLERTTTNGLTNPRPVLFDGIGAGAKINPDLLAVGYTPPESYGQYEAYKPSGDVYSLAATMYSLLTGNIPAHAQERLTVKDNEDLDFSAIDPDLDLKLHKALNTDPNKRYGSALSFLQALQTPAFDISEASDIREALPVPPVAEQPIEEPVPTAFIDANDTIENSTNSGDVDPALKATEVGSILWSDPSENMMPITFGDYAGGTPESTETYQAANAQADTTHNSNVNNTSEVVLNHPAFYQVDGQVNGQVNGQVDNQVQAQQHSPNAEQAIAALNNHNFEQIDFDESIFDQTITEESITEETIQTGVYNYSESIKITAPESFLTQERLISAEEAKTTLFSVHPVHPLHADAQIDAQIDTQTDAQTKALGASNNVIETAINQQTLLHHAELLKGSTAFQYIDGKLKNSDTVENNLALEEDYSNTIIYNTKIADASQQAVVEADALLNTPNTPLQHSLQHSLQNPKELEQTGIKGLTQWPISALTETQSKKTRERKPVQRRFPTLVDVFKTGFSANTSQNASQNASQEQAVQSTSGINLQQIMRIVMLVALLAALGVLLFTMRLQTTPRTPFQNGTARASATPTQNINSNITQPVKHTSNTQPTLAEGERLQVIPEFIFSKHKQAVRTVAFNPEGNIIASAGDDKQLHLWDTQQQTIVKTLQPTTGSAFIKDIAFSKTYLASVDTTGMVLLWDITTGAKRQLDLYKHTSALNTVSFSHDAKFLAAGAEDGKVLVWEYNNGIFGKMQMIDMSQKAINRLSFSPKDNSLLIAADASLRIHLWDSDRNRTQTITAWNSMSRLNDLQLSSDGLHLAAAGLDRESVGIVNIWNVDSRELELTLHHPKFHSESFAIRPESANSVRAITADPQGQWWASAGIDGIIHLWSSESGALLESMSTGQKGIYTLDANPISQGLVTAASDGSVQTWSIQ